MATTFYLGHYLGWFEWLSAGWLPLYPHGHSMMSLDLCTAQRSQGICTSYTVAQGLRVSVPKDPGGSCGSSYNLVPSPAWHHFPHILSFHKVSPGWWWDNTTQEVGDCLWHWLPWWDIYSHKLLQFFMCLLQVTLAFALFSLNSLNHSD